MLFSYFLMFFVMANFSVCTSIGNRIIATLIFCNVKLATQL